LIADKLLGHLDAVRETAPGRWVAKCPAHDDRTPSLAIRETENKLILLNCFAGCSVYEVVSSVGLELSDLFPDKPKSNKSISRPFPAADILRCLSGEISVLMLCASDLAKGEKLDDETKDRLLQSAARFQSALLAGNLI